MKKRSRFNVALLLVAVLLVQDSRAQDDTSFSLPEGVQIRLSNSDSKLSGSIAYSPDGTRLAVSSALGIWLYNPQTGAAVDLLMGPDQVHPVAFSSDGTTLAGASGYGTLRLWDANTGQEKTTLDGHTWFITSLAFAPDGTTLASGSSDGTVRLWDIATGQSQAILEAHGDGVYSVAFAPDGKTIACGTRDSQDNLIEVTRPPAALQGMIQLWDIATGQLKNTLEWHEGSVSSVAFAPDGKTIACGRNNDMIQLWDVDTGQLKNTLEGHTFVVSSVAFSPDGNILASGSLDHTVRLWDADTGQSWATLRGHRDRVYSVAFAPDGNTLASGSDNGTILLWDMSPYITPSTPTAIELSPPLPTQTALLANYPNPFNPNTYIPYQLHAPAHVRLTIYDIRGALICEIDLGYQQAGQYLTSANAAHWDGRDQRGQRVASGVYLYQLQAGPVVHGRKMLLVK